MTVEVFANTPSTTVASGGTDAPASGTVETWTVTSSAEFPAASATSSPPTQFHVGDPQFPSEVVAVTNVSGTTWTVTRGAENTTPVQHAADFTIWQVTSAGAFGAFAIPLAGSRLLPGIAVPPPSGDTSGVTDTAAIQPLENAAATSGGKLVWAPGNYWVTGLTKHSLTYWEGAGEGATVVNLAAGSNADIVQGAGFSSLTLTGASTWGSSGIYDCGIAGMTLDGNRANQSATSFGIRLYGYMWTFRDLSVRNCYSSGLWTEWGALSSNAPVTSDGSEGTASNVRSFYNGVHGWMHLGPSDVRKNNVLCFENNQNAGAAGIGYWALKDQVSNICLTASGMNGTNASGFTGTFTVQAAALGGATDLYASTGTLKVVTSSGTATMTYTGKTATTFTGCTVTSGSGTFVTGNNVTTSGNTKFTTNGLQLSACHSWSNNHTWAAVLDGQTSETDSHWEGAEYGQLLIRDAVNKSGGFVYDFTGIASGCGIQVGDNASTPGVPASAVIKANSCDIRTRVSAFICDTAAHSSVNWVNASQSSLDVLAVTKTTGTYATTIASGSNGVDISTFTSLSPGTLFVASTQSIPNGAGSLSVATANGNVTCTFTGTNGSNGGSQGGSSRTAGTQFTGVVAQGASPGSTMSTGGAVSLLNMGSVALGGTPDGNERIRLQAQSSTTALSTAASSVQEFGPHSFDAGSSANALRIKASGTDQVNLNTVNSQLQISNGVSLKGFSDNYSTTTWQVAGATGIATYAAVAASGLTGATAGGRYVGATSSGSPAAGTFTTGDFANDLTGYFYLCTAGGSPGTWVTLAPAVTQAHPAAFHPSNPTPTASASLVMMGLGSTCAYTPAASGRVLANVTGLYLTATTAVGMSVGAYYGSGSAPSNSAAQSGSLFGGSAPASVHASSTTSSTPFAFTDVLALTPSTAYWFDLALSTTNASDSAQVTNVSMTFAELP